MSKRRFSWHPLRLGRLAWFKQVAGLGVLALLASGLVAAPSSAAGAYCSLTGMVKNVWTGGAGDGLWISPGNWSLGRAPTITDSADGYVCIDADATVRLRTGEAAEVQAFDVAAGTTLELQVGTFLLAYGNQATRPSVFRSGSTTLLNGTLGGPGKIELNGRMTWSSSTSGASTITTRRCGTGGSCGVPVPGPAGLLAVGNSGVLDVTPLGVNLFDQYRLQVRGQLALRGTGYIAADRGTSLQLLPKNNAPGVGTFLVANDGGFYEGRTLYGLTTLAAFSNAGLLRKSAGTGASVINATYSRSGAGAVRVDSGTLSLPEGVEHAVTVGAADTYGFGSCNGSSYGCQPVADAQEPQTGTLTVPGSDANGASVQLSLDGAGPSGTIASQVHAGATGLAATPASPAVLRLRYDASVLGGKTHPTLVVERAPDNTTSYAVVPACLGNGRPPGTATACVDRRGLAGSSATLADGDALMVVRTTGFSRWRVR